MIDQFRHDISENMNKLQEQTMMTKRRLIFILSGAAFMLLCFLFIVGILRKNEASTLAVQTKATTDQSSQVQLQEQLIAFQSRLEKLESDIKSIMTVQDSQPQAQPQDQAPIRETPLAQADHISQDSQNTDVSHFKEPIAMTDRAIKQFIAMQETPSQDDPFGAAFENQDDMPKVEPQKPVPAPVVKQAVQKAQPTKAQASSTQQTKTPPAPGARVHVVQKGETLSQISVRYFGTPNKWKSIYDANRDRISNINQLKVGTQLVIPQDKTQ